MGRAIKAEVQKMLTTKLWWGMAIAVFACGALFALFLGLILGGDNRELRHSHHEPA